MIEQQHPHIPRGGWIAALLSALGAFVFFLWQPIMDYFITGTYDDNVVLQMDTDSITVDATHKLLNVRVRTANKGSVPFKLSADGKSNLSLEIHHIEHADNGQWIDPTKSPEVANKALVDSATTDITIAPNSYWSREVSVALPTGAYWLQVKLHRPNAVDLTDAVYYQHGK